MQTNEAALVELNDEDLLVVSGGISFTIGGPVAVAFGSGAGASATANRTTGVASSTGAITAAATGAGNLTVTF